MFVEFGYLLFAILLSFVLSYFQTSQFIGRGSDHLVHLFLIKVIKENKRKLFVRVPRILNSAYCGAYPLFLHWLLSFLSDSHILLAAKLLNPFINTIQIFLIHFVLKTSQVPSPIIIFTCLAMALTPQYYHAISARIYGISSRPIGLLLLVVYFFIGYKVNYTKEGVAFVIAATIVGYLIWGFSTFAQQALVLFTFILAVVFGHWILIVPLLLSLCGFFLIHNKYGTSYLKHTILFVKVYATDLAKLFILQRRYSIWRDLFYDIWSTRFKSLKKRFLYAYDNSIIILVFLNPLSLSGAYIIYYRLGNEDPLILFCSQLSLTAMLVFFITSFRLTRFLGEPERYLELVTPFSTIVGITALYEKYEDEGALGLLLYFIIVNCLQLASVYFREATPKQSSDLLRIQDIVNKEISSSQVRFSSNNEELTKYFMDNPWSFARTWSYEEKYAGYSLSETFSVFPFMQKTVFEAALEQYRVNIVLIDKSLFSDIFESSAIKRSMLHQLLDTEKYKLYRLNW